MKRIIFVSVISDVALDGPFYLEALGTPDHRTLGHGPMKTVGGSKAEGRRNMK